MINLNIIYIICSTYLILYVLIRFAINIFLLGGPNYDSYIDGDIDNITGRICVTCVDCTCRTCVVWYKSWPYL